MDISTRSRVIDTNLAYAAQPIPSPETIVRVQTISSRDWKNQAGRQRRRAVAASLHAQSVASFFPCLIIILLSCLPGYNKFPFPAH